MDREELRHICKNTERLLEGKWQYRKTSTDFNDVLDTLKEGEKEKYMPKYLFFGEDNIGTDLQSVFGYSNCFSIENGLSETHDFWYFIVNYNATLVLYEKPKEENSSEKIKFHIYDNVSRKTYHSKDIRNLAEKYSIQYLGAIFRPFNEKFIGRFKMYDQILESEIENYSGKIKIENASYFLDPLFSFLEIQENQDVYVMNDYDEVKIKSVAGVKYIDRTNSKMTISMCSTCKADFYINNFNGQKHRGWYRKIDDEEFLFVDLDCYPDIDEEIYVFKKIK